MDVIPMNAALGAEVRCGDVRKLDDAGIKALRQAWLDNLVVLVRGQEMSDGDLVEFGRRFGELQRSNPLPSPLATEGKVVQGGVNQEFPEVTVVSNIVENGVAQGGLEGLGEALLDFGAYAQPVDDDLDRMLRVLREARRSVEKKARIHGWERADWKDNSRITIYCIPHDDPWWAKLQPAAVNEPVTIETPPLPMPVIATPATLSLWERIKMRVGGWF